MDARIVEHRALRVLRRADLAAIPHWQEAFRGLRKDHRFYEILEETLPQGYDYRYLAIEDENGTVCAIQPCFLLDQDLIAGINPRVTAPVRLIRRVWPRFLTLRTLMVGCVAGEGHMDGLHAERGRNVRTLSAEIVRAARELRASLIVLKEFPAKYRADLSCLRDGGFTRVPSMPMTKLFIGYENFEDYMARALNKATRRKLRKKFAKAAGAPALAMSILTDATPLVDDLFPLYLAVYERSKLHFEKLTPEFFRTIGRLMPDTVRFFVWRQEGRVVAFTLCMLEGDKFYAEYVGLDYSIALDLHLYFHVVRDMTSWAIANGYKWFCSSGLNYDPKLHLRHKLDPVDLYARHTWPLANVILRRVLPLMEPTRYDATLRKFPNYSELWS